MTAPPVELLYWDGCPSHPEALAMLRDILGEDVPVVVRDPQTGRSLRLTVIAEGVESVAELDVLRQYRCDQAQGFHFAGALPVADLEVLLGRSARDERTITR